MNLLLKKLDWFISRSLILLMSLIVLTVTWQVVSRYLLQSPSSGSEELARFLLVWIGLLGAVYCYRTKSHLGLNILTNKLAPAQQARVQLLSHCTVLFFAVTTLITGGYNLIHMALTPVQYSAALGVKMAYVYAVLPVSGLLFCCYALASLFQHFTSGSEEVNHGN